MFANSFGYPEVINVISINTSVAPRIINKKTTSTQSDMYVILKIYSQTKT